MTDHNLLEEVGLENKIFIENLLDNENLLTNFKKIELGQY